MTDRGRDLLPLEDATSWEEFQERYAIERARYGVTGRSWKDTGRIAVSVVPGLAAVVFWVAFALTGAGVRWLLLVLALLCTLLFVWALGGVLRRRWRASRRGRRLDLLRDEWHARAERGEVPRTSPDGTKVWRSQIHTEVPEGRHPGSQLGSLPKCQYGPEGLWALFGRTSVHSHWFVWSRQLAGDRRSSPRAGW